jgi:hypothetical protein
MERSTGCAVLSATVFAPLATLTVHDVGNQVGGRAVSSRRTSMPKPRSFDATSCCASACAGVPVMRPHHWSPASRLLREIAASCSTYGFS